MTAPLIRPSPRLTGKRVLIDNGTSSDIYEQCRIRQAREPRPVKDPPCPGGVRCCTHDDVRIRQGVIQHIRLPVAAERGDFAVERLQEFGQTPVYGPETEQDDRSACQRPQARTERFAQPGFRFLQARACINSPVKRSDSRKTGFGHSLGKKTGEIREDRPASGGNAFERRVLAKSGGFQLDPTELRRRGNPFGRRVSERDFTAAERRMQWLAVPNKAGKMHSVRICDVPQLPDLCRSQVK